MKISKIVVGLIVVVNCLVLAALLLANAVLMYLDPSVLFLSQNAVNFMIAFVLIVLAADYFRQVKD